MYCEIHGVYRWKFRYFSAMYPWHEKRKKKKCATAQFWDNSLFVLLSYKVCPLVRGSCDLWKRNPYVFTKSLSSVIWVSFRCTRRCNRQTWPIDHIWRMSCHSYVKQCSQTPNQTAFRTMFSVKICHLSVFKHEAVTTVVNDGKNQNTPMVISVLLWDFLQFLTGTNTNTLKT